MPWDIRQLQRLTPSFYLRWRESKVELFDATLLGSELGMSRQQNAPSVLTSVNTKLSRPHCTSITAEKKQSTGARERITTREPPSKRESSRRDAERDATPPDPSLIPRKAADGSSCCHTVRTMRWLLVFSGVLACAGGYCFHVVFAVLFVERFPSMCKRTSGRPTPLFWTRVVLKLTRIGVSFFNHLWGSKCTHVVVDDAKLLSEIASLCK